MENLIVYNKAYNVAMEVFNVSKTFPKEETYSLTDRKRKYPKSFVSKLTDADGECTETLVHLSFAEDCGYIDEIRYQDLRSKYLEVGKMLGAIINKPENFIVSN